MGDMNSEIIKAQRDHDRRIERLEKVEYPLPGGAGWNHNALSGTHLDTAPNAVLDGALIIGNATPKWSRLAIAIPAANVRNVLGVDNGELRPSWKTALDATNPTTIGVSDAGAPGTSLVFAHRDHQHPSPASYTATAHNLFSTIHGDTTGAAAPVDGDTIIGNATPKWSKLAVTIPAAGILNYLGVNNGELRPSWKSASANPGAAAAILATDASGFVTLQKLTTPSIVMTDGGTIGQAAGPLLTFDDTNNYLGITGCNVGIGTTVPTAHLHLPASTAAANTASMKINPGIVATTPVSGNIESDGTHIYWTDSGGTRRQLDN